MRPPFQERFQVYVMGPNQDSRLATVAAGQVIEKINIKIDLEAPFVLRRRALRRTWIVNGNLNQSGLEFLKTRWTGPMQDYRQGDLMVLESLQQPYFGQVGCPMPVSPEITYPPGGTLTLDLMNIGPGDITGLTFYWIGVNLYPWGVLPAPSYPSEFRGSTFAQPFIISGLVQSAPPRLNQPFKVPPAGDLVIRGGQAGEMGATSGGGGCPPIAPVFSAGVLQPATEISITLKDYNGMPYSNDYVDVNILFGQSAFLAAYKFGPAQPVTPFGTGPGVMGIIYPEIYLPENRQLLIDVQRGVDGGNALEDLIINFIGAKVWKGAREA